METFWVGLVFRMADNSTSRAYFDRLRSVGAVMYGCDLYTFPDPVTNDAMVVKIPYASQYIEDSFVPIPAGPDP